MTSLHISAALLAICCIRLGSAAGSASVTANDTIEGDTAVLVCDYSIDTHPLKELTWLMLNGSEYVVVFFHNDTVDEVMALIDSGSTGEFFNVSQTNVSVQLSHALSMPTVQGADQGTYKCSVLDGADVSTEGTATLDVLVGCESSPCQNGGTCNDTSGVAVCECDPNYIGSHCETLVDECASGPCLNNATCNDFVNNYTCDCSSCYTGYNCESQIVDECASDPCQNGATCLDECFQFVCECVFNYKGTTCELDCDNINATSTPKTVLLGSEGRLECSAAAGTSASKETWWSKSSTGSPRVVTSSVLIVDNVLEADAGTYYCFIEDAGCTSRKFTTLSVTWEIFPNTTSKENVTLKKGDSQDFECSASGQPTPIVQWRFTPKQQVIDTENGTVTAGPPTTVDVGTGNLSSSLLELVKVDVDDSGTYECVAILAGSKEFSIKVINLTVDQTGSSSGLKDWEIALIVIFVLIILAIIIVIIVIIIMKKKNKRGSRDRRSSTVEPSRARPTHRPQNDVEMHKNAAPYSYSDEKKSQPNGNDEYAYAPRALPVPPEGRANKLPSLDVEEERDRLQRRKKKKRQNLDEGYDEDAEQ